MYFEVNDNVCASQTAISAVCTKRVIHRQLQSYPQVIHRLSTGLWCYISSMAGETHVQVTAIWDTTGAWAGEMAQCSWRLAMVPKDMIPVKGQQFTPSVSNFSAAVAETGEDTNYRWARQWRAEWGADSWGHEMDLAIATAVGTYMSSSQSFISPYYRLNTIKTSLIKPDGRSAYGSNVYQRKSPIAGTSTVSTPPELSVATSLRAPVLGRRGRGRWYLPGAAFNATAATEGKVSSAFRDNLCTWGKALVGAFEAAGGAHVDFVPIVAIGSATSATFYRPSQIRAGDHYDVQRRRQHQVAEVYTTQSL